MYTDGHKGYDTLDANGFRHRRVNHSKEFINHKSDHINGLENLTESGKKASAAI